MIVVLGFTISAGTHRYALHELSRGCIDEDPRLECGRLAKHDHPSRIPGDGYEASIGGTHNQIAAQVLRRMRPGKGVEVTPPIEGRLQRRTFGKGMGRHGEPTGDLADGCGGGGGDDDGDVSRARSEEQDRR